MQFSKLLEIRNRKKENVEKAKNYIERNFGTKNKLLKRQFYGQTQSKYQQYKKQPINVELPKKENSGYFNQNLDENKKSKLKPNSNAKMSELDLKRNKRLFNLFQNHLKVASNDLKKESKSIKKREKIQKRVDKSISKDKEKYQKQTLAEAKVKAHLRLRRSEYDLQKVETALKREEIRKIISQLEEKTSDLSNFLVTTTKPPIFYLPKIIDEKLQNKLNLIKSDLMRKLDDKIRFFEKNIPPSPKTPSDFSENFDSPNISENFDKNRQKIDEIDKINKNYDKFGKINKNYDKIDENYEKIEIGKKRKKFQNNQNLEIDQNSRKEEKLQNINIEKSDSALIDKKTLFKSLGGAKVLINYSDDEVDSKADRKSDDSNTNNKADVKADVKDDVKADNKSNKIGKNINNNKSNLKDGEIKSNFKAENEAQDKKSGEKLYENKTVKKGKNLLKMVEESGEEYEDKLE